MVNVGIELYIDNVFKGGDWEASPFSTTTERSGHITLGGFRRRNISLWETDG